VKQIEISLTEPQEDFVFSDYAYPAIVGGLGSGKSRGGTMRLIMLMLDDVGANCAYYMPTYDLLKLRAMSGIEDDLNMLGLPFKTNQSDYTIKVFGYGTIIFRSYDRPERIVAYEVAHSIVDEIDTLPKEKAALVWRKISERNRQKRKRPNTIGVVTTPDQGVNGFVYEKWVKLQQDGYRLYRASTYSNPFLPDGYIQQILDNYDPVLAELYLNGEFVSLNANKVYHYFSRKTHHTDRELLPTDSHLYIGLDFNIGGCCATVCVIDSGNPIAVDEFTSHDTYDVVNNIAHRYLNKTITIYPDASGSKNTTNATQSDIAILTQADLRVDAPNGNPAVRDRVNAVNSLLSHAKLLINTNKCPNLTHALENQGYDERGDPEKYKVHPAIDDWNDSLGYLINRRWPIIRPVSFAQITGT
jgi:PBSX family phage terminase large subunit